MNYDNLRDEQLKVELESDSIARMEALKRLIESAYDGDTDAPRAQVVVARMCASVVQHLQAAADVKTQGAGGKYKVWLRALPMDLAASIAIRECIKQCSGFETVTTAQDLAIKIGQLWELEVRILQADIVNRPYMEKVHKQLKERGTVNQGHIRAVYNVATSRVFKGQVDLTLTDTEMLQIGKFGLDACLQAGIVEIIRTVGSKGTLVYYKLAGDVEEFLTGYTNYDVRAVLDKEEMRMRCPPEPWTTIHDGGYLSTSRKAITPLRGLRKTRRSLKAKVLEDFTAEKMPEVFKAANYIQSIGFEFHRPTVEAVLRVWGAGGGIMGTPLKSGPRKPAFPYAEDWVAKEAPEHEQEVFQRWKRDTARYYEKVKKWRGHTREIGAMIKAMREDSRPFWYPVFFDDRGRWYYRGTPHPQGSDVAKGVLHFHNKRALGERGVFWLKVHIANSSGFDKDRMHARAAWTETHWKRISEALDDPTSDPDVWGKDAPWCVYSAAWELREAYRSGNPFEYKTGVCIHMDATCSGLQHFSALLRDPVGAWFTNLLDPGYGPKQDIYRKVSSVVLERVQKDADAGGDDSEFAKFFLQFEIPRALAKTPVMTYVYGATLAGTAQFVEGFYEEEIFPLVGAKWPEEMSSYNACMYMARKMFEGIAETVPAAAAAMRWLRQVARENPSGKPMQWHTPCGFKVVHDYQDFTDARVRVRSCGVEYLIVRDWGEGTRMHAMQNALPPNFTHGQDATHVTLTANAMCDAGHEFVGIHDSFGTHPSSVDAMHVIIREQFLEMYRRPSLLTTFMWEVDAKLEVPERGDFDLSNVLRSEFFFS